MDSFAQLLEEAHAEVFEHGLALFLGSVEVDVGLDGEIVVALGIAEYLAHMPHVLGLLVGFVDGKEGCGARVGVDGDLPVLLEVRVEGALPARLAAAMMKSRKSEIPMMLSPLSIGMLLTHWVALLAFRLRRV